MIREQTAKHYPQSDDYNHPDFFFPSLFLINNIQSR